MTKLLDEPPPASQNPSAAQQVGPGWDFPVRPNILEQSIREEPEDEDLFPLPRVPVAPTAHLQRWGSKVLAHVGQRGHGYGYGSFQLRGTKLLRMDVAGSAAWQRRPSRPQERSTPGRLAFVALVVLIIVALTVGIIVEWRADHRRHSPPLPASPASGLLSSQFPELRQQILRTKHFVSAENQEKALADMLRRLLPPAQAGLFTLAVIPAAFDDPALDTANISSINGSVHITGNSGTACSFALYHFLKYYCGAHVSWSARQLALPDTLPDVSVVVSKADLLHYYQNVCTSSYSFAWWNWTRWEEEIDWMALQGINFPLAFTGQEEMWRRVYTRLGLTEAELDDFFVGPAFLAWGRMGNIRQWAGPLSRNWMDQQVQLQKQILARMQSFGMIPILPAFNGIVPVALLRLYPSLNLTRMTNWASFPDDMTGSYFLDPHEELFEQLADLFITQMTSEYQYTSHFYNADTFNEQKPRDPSGWDAEFIRETMAVSYAGMRQADPNAFWVMQAWMLFYDAEFWTPERTEALLTAIPTGRLIMLDLFAEVQPIYNTTASFHGQPFIWCMLHNFGGVLGLYGRLTAVTTGPVAGREYVNSSMVGVGLAPEGINQNDMMYELMNEMAWRTQTPDVDQWVAAYSDRRYGGEVRDGERAYHALRTSVWEAPSSVHDNGHYALTQRPRFGILEPMWYEPDQVFVALKLLLQQSASVPSPGRAGLLYDVVDVTRQTLQIAFAFFYGQLEEAYSKKDLHSLMLQGDLMELILLDMEALLRLHPAFQLTPWLQAATAWGESEAETALLRWNALNQISLWGPEGQIADYAGKQWSGVVGHYLHPRWHLFITLLIRSLQSGVPFNQTAFDQQVFEEVERPFTFSTPGELPGEDMDVADLEAIVRKAESLHQRYHTYRSPHFVRSLPTKAFTRRNGTHPLHHHPA